MTSSFRKKYGFAIKPISHPDGDYIAWVTTLKLDDNLEALIGVDCRLQFSDFIVFQEMIRPAMEYLNGLAVSNKSNLLIRRSA